jgi:hypothetical protein
VSDYLANLVARNINKSRGFQFTAGELRPRLASRFEALTPDNATWEEVPNVENANIQGLGTARSSYSPDTANNYSGVQEEASEALHLFSIGTDDPQMPQDEQESLTVRNGVKAETTVENSLLEQVQYSSTKALKEEKETRPDQDLTSLTDTTLVEAAAHSAEKTSSETALHNLSRQVSATEEVAKSDKNFDLHLGSDKIIQDAFEDQEYMSAPTPEFQPTEISKQLNSIQEKRMRFIGLQNGVKKELQKRSSMTLEEIDRPVMPTEATDYELIVERKSSAINSIQEPISQSGVMAGESPSSISHNALRNTPQKNDCLLQSALPRLSKQDFAVPENTPTVNVTIGRVEVKAVTAPTISEAKARPTPVMTLEEYLQRRTTGGG